MLKVFDGRLKNVVETLISVKCHKFVLRLVETGSASGRFCVVLRRAPGRDAIQVAALLDVSRVCCNDGIGDTQKTFRNNSRDLDAIEVLLLYLPEDLLQCVLDLLRSEGAKEHHLDFSCHEKEVPSCGMDLAIKGEAIQPLD